MNEKTMTLGELMLYAWEAKEQTEKEQEEEERKKLKAQKQVDCINLIKEIIDELKANKGQRTTTVEQTGMMSFKINDKEFDVSSCIQLEDIKTMINIGIPALQANIINEDGVRFLKVWFSHM